MRVRPPPRIPRHILLAVLILAGGLIAVAVLGLIVLPDREAPTQVTGLRVEDLLAGRLQIRWDAAQDNVGVAAYRLYRNEIEIASMSGSTTSYVDDGLLVDVFFEYRADAVDVAGNAGPKSVRARASSAPAKPTLSLSSWVVDPPSGRAVGVATVSQEINLTRYHVGLFEEPVTVVIPPQSPLELPQTRDNLTLSFEDAAPLGDLSAGDRFVLRGTPTGATYFVRLIYVPASEVVADSASLPF